MSLPRFEKEIIERVKKMPFYPFTVVAGNEASLSGHVPAMLLHRSLIEKSSPVELNELGYHLAVSVVKTRRPVLLKGVAHLVVHGPHQPEERYLVLPREESSEKRHEIDTIVFVFRREDGRERTFINRRKVKKEKVENKGLVVQEELPKVEIRKEGDKIVILRNGERVNLGELEGSLKRLFDVLGVKRLVAILSVRYPGIEAPYAGVPVRRTEHDISMELEGNEISDEHIELTQWMSDLLEGVKTLQLQDFERDLKRWLEELERKGGETP